MKREDSNNKRVLLGAAGASLGYQLGNPIGQLAYATEVLGRKGTDSTKSALKKKLNPFKKKDLPKTFLSRLSQSISKRTDSIKGLDQVYYYVDKMPRSIIKNKKEILDSLTAKRKFLQNRGKAGTYGSLAGAIAMGIFGTSLEKTAKDRDNRGLLVATGVTGAAIGSSAGQFREAYKEFYLNGNDLTRRVFKEKIDPRNFKFKKPENNFFNIDDAKKIFSMLPETVFNANKTSKKDALEALTKIENFSKNRKVPAVVGAIAGGVIAPIVYSIGMQKKAGTIPIRGATPGPRNADGVARVNRIIPRVGSEPAGNPIVSKKQMKSFLSKKNMQLPGNINNIGKLT